MTVTGKTGYLGLQTNLDEELAGGNDIVMNTALPTMPLPSPITMMRC